jgi:hypothetical protein
MKKEKSKTQRSKERPIVNLETEQPKRPKLGVYWSLMNNNISQQDYGSIKDN